MSLSGGGNGLVATGKTCQWSGAFDSSGNGINYFIPAYQVQSGDTYDSITENFYGTTSSTAVGHLATYNNANYDSNGQPIAVLGDWLALPTALFGATNTYSFNCADLTASPGVVTITVNDSSGPQGVNVADTCGMGGC